MDLGHEVVDREYIHHSSLSSQLWRIVLGQSHLLIRNSSIKFFQIQQKHAIHNWWKSIIGTFYANISSY